MGRTRRKVSVQPFIIHLLCDDSSVNEAKLHLHYSSLLPLIMVVCCADHLNTLKLLKVSEIQQQLSESLCENKAHSFGSVEVLYLYGINTSIY